jgi:hypothetical protein
MEEVMRLVAKLCAAIVVCAMLGFYVGAASGDPWRLGKNKLPRLSSRTQSIAVEQLIVAKPGISIARKRHNR